MKTKKIKKLLANLFFGSLLSLAIARAADKITFFFAPPAGEFTILIKNLKIFACEGKITPAFAFYADRLDKVERDKLRQFLQVSLPFNEVQIFRFLNSYIGKITVEQLSKMIGTLSEQRQPFLKGALVQAAGVPCRLTLLVMFSM
jgi:hypothetical protein